MLITEYENKYTTANSSVRCCYCKKPINSGYYHKGLWFCYYHLLEYLQLLKGDKE